MRQTLWIPAHSEGLGYLLAHNPWSGTQSDCDSLSLAITIQKQVMTFPLTLEPGESWIIGRSREADISIDDPTLSRRHLRITRRYHDFTIEDLGSRNGTRLGVEPVTARVTLEEGQVIRAGQMRIESTSQEGRKNSTLTRPFPKRHDLERILFGILGVAATWCICGLA